MAVGFVGAKADEEVKGDGGDLIHVVKVAPETRVTIIVVEEEKEKEETKV